MSHFKWVPIVSLIFAYSCSNGDSQMIKLNSKAASEDGKANCKVAPAKLSLAGGPTYEVEIKAMIAANCVSCHNPVSGPRRTPFLTTYEQVRAASAISISEIETNSMPPPPGTFAPADLVLFKAWRDANFPLAPAPVPPSSPKVVYMGVIDKLLNDNCLSCHKPGMSLPDLSNFEDAKAEAMNSLAEMQAGTMPIAGRLPQTTIDLFKKWIDDGTLLELTGTATAGTTSSSAAKPSESTSPECL